MPGVLSAISMYSPFAGLHYYPAMVYLGRASLEAFLVPMLWCLVLTAVALWLTHLARRKMEIQGG
jgi:ABC-2 type transport system permease protein